MATQRDPEKITALRNETRLMNRSQQRIPSVAVMMAPLTTGQRTSHCCVSPALHQANSSTGSERSDEFVFNSPKNCCNLAKNIPKADVPVTACAKRLLNRAEPKYPGEALKSGRDAY